MSMERKIVYAYVCGDILHIGHISALENAKSLGDKLIVGVLTDEAVMEKKVRPIISFRDRMEGVKALKCVDAVVAQPTYSPIENIKAIKPDILMESTSHTDEDLKETYAVAKELGIRVIKMPYFPEMSSTSIKEKCKNT
jgi:rfaE bifunctional protein nucleotidyltransferase chain/domain